MAVYLDKNEEEKRWEEAKEYADKREAEIEEARINGKARRQKQDKLFQKGVILVFAIVLILLVISWAR
ncbi:MAG: hypothetical protein K6E85_17800 [Lachnospiraceae bacterium]|nr:hypothetical protein [Lachnospiraceae bacterium]